MGLPVKGTGGLAGNQTRSYLPNHYPPAVFVADPPRTVESAPGDLNHKLLRLTFPPTEEAVGSLVIDPIYLHIASSEMRDVSVGHGNQALSITLYQ